MPFLTCCLGPQPQLGTPRYPILLASANTWVPDSALACGGDHRLAAGAGGKSSSACRPPWHPARDQPGLCPDWLSPQSAGRSLVQFRFRGVGGTPGKRIPCPLSTKTREGQTYQNAIVLFPLSVYPPIKGSYINNVFMCVRAFASYRRLKESPWIIQAFNK